MSGHFRLRRVSQRLAGGVIVRDRDLGAGPPPRHCTVCHTEHEGPTLRNDPATSGCAGCHSALDSKLPDTRLPNRPTGTGIIPSSAPPWFAASMAARHGWSGSRSTSTPVHLPDRFLTLSQFPHGKHEDVRCATCHAAGRSEAATDLLLPAIATRRSCHGNAAWAARHPDAEASGDCGTCHWFHPDSRAPGFAALERPARGIAQKR